MASKKPYNFEAKICLYQGQTAWHYITLPLDVAKQIRQHCDELSRSLEETRVEVTIEKTTWRTKLFKHKESKSYLLPLKTTVKSKNGPQVGDTLAITLSLLA